MATRPFPTPTKWRVWISPISSSLPLFIFWALLLLPFSSASSPISYADNCGAIVRESATSASVDSLDDFNLVNGFFFSSGDGFLFHNDRSPSDSSGSRTFAFHPRSVHRTQNPNTLQITGDATFRYDGWLRGIRGRKLYQIAGRPLHRVRPRPLPRALRPRGLASFDLSGFWSAATGNLCLVGSGHAQPVEGKALELSAVLKLNLPNVLNISSSLVGGTLEIFDSTNSSNHFDPIYVVAYSGKSYQYTRITETRGSFVRFTNVEELVGFQSDSLCSELKLLSRATFKLDYQSNCFLSFCSPFSHIMGFTPTFMSLNQIGCSDDGRIHMFVGFSNLSYYGSSKILNPARSLVAEGIWNKKMNQLGLVACYILESSAGSFANLSVDDCTVRISLWLPAVWSIHSRSSILGRIWSTHKIRANSYFDMISFSDSVGYVHNNSSIKYKYTLVDDARKSCPQGSFGNVLRRFPDVASLPSRRFSIYLRDDIEHNRWGFFNPVSIGKKVYSYSPMMAALGQVSYHAAEVLNETVMNVSYQIRFPYKNTNFDPYNDLSFSAEGLYDARKGLFCMVGCRHIELSFFPNHTITNDSTDCRIFINVQLAPLNLESGDHLVGSIRSTRDKKDPLYFQPLEFMSNYI